MFLGAPAVSRFLYDAACVLWHDRHVIGGNPAFRFGPLTGCPFTGWFLVSVLSRFRYIQPFISANVKVLPHGVVTVFAFWFTFNRARAWQPRQMSCAEAHVWPGKSLLCGEWQDTHSPSLYGPCRTLSSDSAWQVSQSWLTGATRLTCVTPSFVLIW